MSCCERKTFFDMPLNPSFVHPITDFPPHKYFETSEEFVALIVPVSRVATLRKALRHVMLDRPKVKSIYPADCDPLYRKLILADRKSSINDPIVQEILNENNTGFDSSIKLTTHVIQRVDEVLQALLPCDEVPSSFESVGPIAHVNLREEWLPFQYIIGKVLLDKNKPRIRYVVHKEGPIDTTYRTFGMKIIASLDSVKDWSIVTLREEGCRFTLDFQQVYWNSRLAGEHRRLVQEIRSSDQSHTQESVVVADVMAGVGPFSIPLTSANSPSVTRTCLVYANDLNPYSYEYLNINAKQNRCKNLNMYNMDGRSFIHLLQESKVEFHHAIMNLPASAPEFLDAFRGFYGDTLPKVHVYCFAPKSSNIDGYAESIARCELSLGCKIHNPCVHLVRDVSPKKNMLCISFDLPELVRSLERIKTTESTELSSPNTKRAKTDHPTQI
jgi:tRNA (guanine37-N1)-methyltransferase